MSNAPLLMQFEGGFDDDCSVLDISNCSVSTSIETTDFGVWLVC